MSTETLELAPEVQPREQLRSDAPEDVATLKKLAIDARTSAEKAMGKYVTLCEHAREKQITRKVLTATLLEAGFVKSRASEVCRLAFVSPEIFQAWKTGLIGMKPALERARDEDAPAQGSGKTGEPSKAKKRKTPAARFKSGFTDFLSEWVPVAGDLPPFLVNVKFKVNGAWASLNVTREA